MEMNNSGLWWGVAIVDSAVGSGMFVYGIRQKAGLPLIAGIALNIVPMLLGTTLGELALTALIGVAYFIVRKFV